MRQRSSILLLSLTFSAVAAGCSTDAPPTHPLTSFSSPDFARGGTPLNPKMLSEGQQIFRFETFGDETYWTDTLQLQKLQPRVHNLFWKDRRLNVSVMSTTRWNNK